MHTMLRQGRGKRQGLRTQDSGLRGKTGVNKGGRLGSLSVHTFRDEPIWVDWVCNPLQIGSKNGHEKLLFQPTDVEPVSLRSSFAEYPCQTPPSTMGTPWESHDDECAIL